MPGLTHAFLIASANLTVIDAPGAIATFGRGLNARDVVVGNCTDGNGSLRAFVASKQARRSLTQWRAANYAAFPIFLIALVILTPGMTTVQVAANPYVTKIGRLATASSPFEPGAGVLFSRYLRCALFFGSLFILRGDKAILPQLLHLMTEPAREAYRMAQASSVRLPYIGMAIALSCAGLLLSLIKLKSRQSLEVPPLLLPKDKLCHLLG